MFVENYFFDEALHLVKRTRPMAQPHELYVQQLKEFDEMVFRLLRLPKELIWEVISRMSYQACAAFSCTFKGARQLVYGKNSLL
jgi:hypothetical protein